MLEECFEDSKPRFSLSISQLTKLDFSACSWTINSSRKSRSVTYNTDLDLSSLVKKCLLTSNQEDRIWQSRYVELLINMTHKFQASSSTTACAIPCYTQRGICL